MALFEALYGRKCRSRLYWDEVDERRHLRSKIIVQTVDIIRIIREYFRAAQSRHKSWADSNRRLLESRASEHGPIKGVIRFRVREKLSLRYISQFKILERVGEVAYKFALPPLLEGVHNVFHVSQCRRYVRDERHILDHSELKLQSDLSYTEQSMVILDRSVKTLKNKAIPLVLVSWNRRAPGEATWEREDVICEHDRQLFVS